MRLGILGSFLLFFSSLASGQDLCTDPFGAICGSMSPPRFTPQSIRAESPLKLDATPKESVLTRYAVVLKHLRKVKITESALEAHIDQLNSRLSKILRSGHLPFPKFANAVKKVRYARPSEFLKNPDSEEALVFFQTCGSDGMVNNAFFYKVTQRFILCPGFLLSALNEGSLSVIDTVVTHEISHSFDPIAVPSHFDTYQGYLNCIDRHFTKDLVAADAAMTELDTNGRKRLETKIQYLKKSGASAREIADYEESLEGISPQLDRIQGVVDRIEARTGAPATRAQTHCRELTADLGAWLTTAQLIKELPASQRRDHIARTFRPYCESVSAVTQVKYGSLDDEGLHPSIDFRLRQFFNNPEVRGALGCENLVSLQPWCKPNGSVGMGARCGKDAKVATANGCESTLKSQLKSAGCRQNHLDCEPKQAQQFDCLWESDNCRGCTSRPASGTEQFVSGGPPLGSVCLNPDASPPPQQRADPSGNPRAGSAHPD